MAARTALGPHTKHPPPLRRALGRKETKEVQV